MSYYIYKKTERDVGVRGGFDLICIRAGFSPEQARYALVFVLGDFFISKELEWGGEARISLWKFYEQAMLFPTLGLWVCCCPNITSFRKPSLMLPSQPGSRGDFSSPTPWHVSMQARPSIRTQDPLRFSVSSFSPILKCLLASWGL